MGFFRNRGGDPVGVNRRVVKAFGLQENLVAVAVGKAHNLVLNRRTIARTNAGRATAIDRRFAEALGDDLMRGFIGIGDAAGDLGAGNGQSARCGQERKRRWAFVASLALNRVPIDRAAIQARWRARL